MVNTNDLSEHVKLEGLDLAEGQSMRTDCPVCGGGSSKEKSFSITRKDNVLMFHCFRDKCRTSGGIGSRGNFTGQALSKATNTKTKQYEGELFLLSGRSSKFLKNKFGLEDQDIAAYRETVTGDVMMPMKDHLGRQFGYVNRRYEGLVGSPRKPKTINYYDRKPEHNLHFDTPITSQTDTVVLVEDIVSARRLGKHYTCIALLGTQLRQDEATLLLDLGIKDVVFVLDADANASAVKQQKEYCLLFRSCYAIRQSKDSPDPKDCDSDEMQYLVDLIDHITTGETI